MSPWPQVAAQATQISSMAQWQCGPPTQIQPQVAAQTPVIHMILLATGAMDINTDPGCSRATALGSSLGLDVTQFPDGSFLVTSPSVILIGYA